MKSLLLSQTSKENQDMFSDVLAVVSCSWIESGLHMAYLVNRKHTLAAAKMTSFPVFLLFTFTVGLLSRGDSACPS